MEHIRAYEELQRRLGPIVSDVTQALFALPVPERNTLLTAYRNRYGDKAADYAEQTFELWRSGARKMSGQTAERLINLVPTLLSSEQRYQLIKKLYQHHQRQQHTTRYVTIDPKVPSAALPHVREAMRCITQIRVLASLPKDAMTTIQWINDADVVAARALLAAIEQADQEMTVQQVKRSMADVEALLRSPSTKSFREVFRFPNGTLIISSEKSSQCFVATAVYEDANHPDLVTLRSYRDTTLRANLPGRVFIRVYYAIGPLLAAAIRPFPSVKRHFRRWLSAFAYNLRRN